MKPAQKPQSYNIVVRVIDGRTLHPMSRAAVGILHSNGHQFVETELFYTDHHGSVYSANRPTGEIELLMLDMDGWIAPPHGMKPLPGEPVHVMLRARRLPAATLPYTWRAEDRLKSISALVGHSPEEILKSNQLSNEADLHAGLKLSLPCFGGSYQMAPRDTVERVSAHFCYESPKELAKHNRVEAPDALPQLPTIELPGWRFLYGRRGGSFRRIDEMFDLPHGWTRAVFYAYRPIPEEPIQHEAIAVPDRDFVKSHRLVSKP